jgi:hypothetical protein
MSKLEKNVYVNVRKSLRRLKCIRVMRKQNVIKMLRFFTISFNQANDVYVKIYETAQLTMICVFQINKKISTYFGLHLQFRRAHYYHS